MPRYGIRPSRRRATGLATAAAIALCHAGCARDAGERSASRSAPAAGAYRFSEDWFSHNIPVWQEVLGPLRGRPDLRYLEVGVFEGRSVVWMLENVLTHPGSRVTGLDLFPTDGLLRRYEYNLRATGQARRATTIRGRSQIELRRLPPESFDVIYVDGSHTAGDVMADAVLSWVLLKDGGILIFDDYAWPGYDRGRPDRRSLPPDLRPELALDAFLTAYRLSLDVVHRGYQLIVRKRQNPCPALAAYHCTPLGEYYYLWRARALHDQGSRRRVDLTERELDLIEQLLLSISLGQTEPVPPPPLRYDPAFRRLAERLLLTFPARDSAP